MFRVAFRALRFGLITAGWLVLIYIAVVIVNALRTPIIV